MRRKLWMVWMLLLCVAANGFAAEAPASDDAFAGVEVKWNEEVSGGNNLMVPYISGLSDTAVEAEINAKILEKMPVEQIRMAMDRAASWGDEDMGEGGIKSSGSAFRRENLLSVVCSVRGLLDDDTMIRQRYYTMNFDLLTGQEITFADLFQNPEAAVASLESIIQTAFDDEEINTYLENAQVLPMPQDNFSLDESGMTVYYPANQYSHISGTAGAFRFLDYELEPLLSAENPLTDLLASSLTLPEDTAEIVMQEIAAGSFRSLPMVQLGEALSGYDELFSVVAEPDYTLTERLYQFESPVLDRVWLGTPLYLEEGAEETVSSIRTTHIDFYGLRPGVSTLSDVVGLLGDPDGIREVDDNQAFNALLPAGQSYLYHHEGNSIIFHGKEDGTLYCIILEVQGTSDPLL